MTSTSGPYTRSEILSLAEDALVEGRPEDTLELCREILAREPGHAEALHLEAEALRDLREASAAEDVYRRLLDVDPGRAEAWSGLGFALFDQARFDEAHTCFTRALRLSADEPEAWYGRALVRERRGDHAGAMRDYTRAWRLSDEYPPPRPLDDTELRALLREAAEGASEAVRAWVATAPVVVLDLPDAETCQAYDPPASPAELLGHLTLHPMDSTLGGWTRFPPAVLLFRRNLERWADDRHELVQALREGVLAHVGDWLDSPEAVS